jgi:hypothetical protein
MTISLLRWVCCFNMWLCSAGPGATATEVLPHSVISQLRLLVSDEVPNLRTEDVIRCCLARPAPPPPRGNKDCLHPGTTRPHDREILSERRSSKFGFMYLHTCLFVCVCIPVCPSIYLSIYLSLYYDTYIATCINCMRSSVLYLKFIYHILLLTPSVNFRIVYVTSALNGLLKCIHRCPSL